MAPPREPGVTAPVDRPTVLVVGHGERMADAIATALERYELLVERADVEAVVEAAFAAAPDLLLLVGDAAADGGQAAVSRLATHSATALVPVVLLSDDPGLGPRLDAFRHGIVAVVERTASADQMARRVAVLAQQLPERPGVV
ncbi:MAG: hypothetical protein ACFCGT_18710 [Sandaracinaceae bacterium]